MRFSSSRHRQRGATPFTLVLAVFVVILAVLVVVNALSAYKTSTARRDWEGVFGSWDEVMRRYPATEANTAALELERLAASLGVGIAPRHTDRSGGLAKEPSARFNQVKRTVLYDYPAAQMERAVRGAIDPPPPELVSYIADHEEALLALRRHLTRGVVPVWESDLSAAAYAPLPNLLGHIDLQKLLTGVALARLHSGDSAGALADLEAARQLSRSLRDSPILISQLILIAGTRLQLGVLRHIPDVDQVWLDRLDEHDFRESFLTAMKFEAWVWLYCNASDFAGEGFPIWQRLVGPVARPYTKLCLADLSDAWRERLVNLAQVDALCDRDLARYGADFEIPIPRWNKLGESFVPNLTGAIGRLARLELDLELTRLLIEADRERRANGGVWPEGLLTARACESCPDDQWNYRVTGEGLEIALSRDVRWPGQKGVILPTCGRL